MPDRGAHRRALAALAVGVMGVGLLGVGLLSAPTVDAQTDPPPTTQPTTPPPPDPPDVPDQWDGSRYESPGEGPQTKSQLTTGGVFVHQASHIESVDLVYGRPIAAPDGTLDVDDADDDSCVPVDPPRIVTDGDGDKEPRNQVFQFSSAATWSCNGTFAIKAIPRNNVSSYDFEMIRALEIAVPPAPVTEVSAVAAGNPDPATGPTADDPEQVDVSWVPLAAPTSDAQGYAVERAGPDGETFARIGSAGPGEDGYEDEITEPGTYTYRVRAIRPGARGGEVLSPTADSATTSVDVAGPPDPTTTTSTATQDGATVTRDTPLTLPRAVDGGGGGGTLRVPGRATTTTTIDPGFEDSLDYGELPEPGDEEALAGEGQSVIRAEGDGAGLVGPVAGALVLLGWAGHVAYLNRLAKQF